MNRPGIGCYAIAAVAVMACAEDRPSGTIGPGFSDSVGFVATIPSLDSVALPTHRLSAVQEYGDSDSWALPAAMILVHEYLIVADRFASPHLSVVHIPTGEIRERFGPDGQGPREFRDPTWLFKTHAHAPDFWIFDLRSHTFTQASLNADASINLASRFLYAPPIQVINPILRSDTVVSNGFFADFTIVVTDRKGKERYRTAAPPLFDEEAIPDPGDRRLANVSYATVAPTTGLIALGYQNLPRIDFVTREGNFRGSVEGPRTTIVNFGYRDGRFGYERDHQSAYMSITSSDSYVYALFCGCVTPFEYEFVEVFDWSGRWIAEIQLDRPVNAIYVSPDDANLFGGGTAPLPFLARWELPRFVDPLE